MLPPGVEGMRWEMLAFLFTIGSRQFGNDIQKMDIQELVTNMCKEKRKRRKRQSSHITIIHAELFNSNSPIGNFIFFFFLFFSWDAIAFAF